MSEELLSYKDKIVVVSKNHSLEEIRPLYQKGYRMFGENRVQELLSKTDNDMPEISWHLIGHLQTNKAKYAVRHCDLIHSADSLKCLQAINHEAEKIRKVQSVLIQVNIAKEATKFGIMEEDLFPLVKQAESLSSLSIEGIMVIGPHVQDPGRIRAVFTEGRKLYERGFSLKQDNVHWKTLSMGMSQDYKIALECGTTLMRLGHIMFGLGGGTLY